MAERAQSFVKRWIITTVAVLVATQMVSGIHYQGWDALLIATFTLGLLNAFIRPMLLFFSLPLLLFTLGLFTLVINAGLLMFVGHLFKGFRVDDFGSAFWGALVISVVSTFLNVLTGSTQVRASLTTPSGRPPPNNGRGGNSDKEGPVIDV